MPLHRVRLLKGTLAAAVAAAVCHSVMSVGYTSAREAGADDGPWGGIVEFGFATGASWILMPILLWAGMRLMREKGTVLLAVVGGFVWFLVSGWFIDDIDSVGGHMPFAVLIAYALTAGALAGVEPARR
ncbi:hypothetical protein [Streptomyces clavuligerus]|uniref:Integral membrane protein n=1 Tax=Streptomyces clavuligerus TaxID=1901 RepID=B5H0B6_STRCL|nr:hypothetical protein [Streptomyces clavuligerus]ANW17293.1 hypothetical protein BB341_03175 [Streptomyces clavuligerus]AXU11839.1 hypothetical protein D1794_03335 [Streptomyces clavuligerus]EDY52012.1 hypothetical protein SSCG_05077 [Streptomyces clavuligerus]EFG10237.1 Hypothetical protein SCLAV_5163 [Streptomyces clavuligerus]MBY6301676.1 hypothetical protein [Streptomyces clavuligerus]